ncbi:21643_t:CDS:2 [Rhizophagus irregularis]|nr:21643_t:CDS:2 [Rhizophagus irregularis]
MIGKYFCPFLYNTEKPTASACDRCSDHVRGYYVIQFYDRLQSESLRLEIQERLRSEICERLQCEIQEKTYEKMILTHSDVLANLNIFLCKECLYPIKLEKGEYCNRCQSK